MSRGYTVRYNPGRHHQIEARDMRILEEAVSEQDRDECPDCGGHLRAKWSGVECGVCGYTFCY